MVLGKFLTTRKILEWICNIHPLDFKKPVSALLRRVFCLIEQHL